jgi:uncharacterized protein YqjF (DUF2071 family)
MTAPFLTARWLHLVLLNYSAPRALLEPLVPRGTELHAWQGETLVSLVGFMFCDTRVRGLSIPWHRDFEEVNLRFYVKRPTASGDRRAVVFVREFVPRWAIASVARWVYNEPYLALAMSHEVSLSPDDGGEVRYGWRQRGHECSLSATTEGAARAVAIGSEAEFITEHYWGYTRQRDGSTLEYQVEHPSWLVWDAHTASFEGSAEHLYGADFAPVLRAAPRSAFVAVGSEVTVRRGVKIAS